MYRFFVYSAFIILLSSCGGNETPYPNKFSDTTFVKLYEFQDRRFADSLIAFIGDTNLLYKRAAILSFASIQDTTFINKLYKKLDDEDAVIRKNTAFALGQTGGSRVPELLLRKISDEQDSIVHRDLFEAYGKVVGEANISNAANLHNQNLPWLYYRYALRENCDSLIVNHVSEFLSQDYPTTTRLGAAHFFARGKIDGADFVAEKLIQSAKNDPLSEVRMAAAAGLKNIKTPLSKESIKEILSNEKDYRVRVNAVRSLVSFSIEETKDILYSALEDSAVNVRIATAETIRSVLKQPQCKETLALARTTDNWRVQAILFEAIMMTSLEGDKEDILKDIMKIYSLSDNNYQKALLFQAMAQSPESFQFIRNELLSANTPLLQSAAAMAIVGLNRADNFPSALKQSFLETYIGAIEKGDVAVIGIVTDALMDSTLGYKKIVKNTAFLEKAKGKLSLPRDYESYVPLENAIAYFENRDAVPVEKNFNHPIDWNLIKTIEADQLAVIKTTKGDITIQLFVEEAPGSVGNFVDLIMRDYYDGKFFHRVVPNFVIQGGCPRGDGWGGEDYSIRSEFSGRRYKTGSVGMASAGKDTEGVQWFITHSPTPHLDGRYTIFAEVTKGMEVVHAIEVGDRIVDIQLLNSSTQ